MEEDIHMSKIKKKNRYTYYETGIIGKLGMGYMIYDNQNNMNYDWGLWKNIKKYIEKLNKEEKK